MTTISSTNLRRIPVKTGLRLRSDLLPFELDQVWVDQEVENHPQTIRILSRLNGIETDVIEDHQRLKRRIDFGDAKKQLFLAAHRGAAFKPCQGMISGQVCCNLRVLDLVSGCPMDCSYCILQAYLANNPITTVYVNLETILSQVADFLTQHNNHFFRICTGELSDSLVLDPVIDYAPILIQFFAHQRNAMLELKTKTAYVDHLLKLAHNNRTVISWSVNTADIINAEERGTASLDERFEAARKVAAAGFGVGFHFDPIIILDGDKDVVKYLEIVDRILDTFRVSEIAWVSLGMLRYPVELQEIAAKRFANSRIFCGEMVPAGGKMRYLRFIRERTLKSLWDRLVSKLPPHKVYMCMETEAVWQKIDPTVKSNSCIEKRLCNMESIAAQ